MSADLLLRDCECAIITSPASLYYLSGFDQADAMIVVTREMSYYLTNPLYEVAVKERVGRDLIVKILGRAEQQAFLRETISQVKRVGVEYRDMNIGQYLSLFGSLEVETVDLSDAMAMMRSVKSSSEIEIITQAEAIVDRAFSEIIPRLQIGVSEKEIRDELLIRLLKNGAEGTAFDTIVAFGGNAAMPHAVPSDRVLRKGDCILMDFGAKYKGYCSDFTRTLCCGEPSEEFRAGYDIVLSAQRAALAYIEAGGRSCAEADRIAREIIESSEFKGKFTHTLGHGVGIEIHEFPSLSPKSKDLLTDGSIFTVEPGIYLEGRFGIRIESLAKIENGKLTVIDRSDKEIIIV